jgi:ABC-type lipoprotein release transport system permease subunit
LLPRAIADHDWSMSGNSPERLWGRRDLRARATSLVVVGVLAGLTAGLAVAAFDGATRTDSALTRLREQTNASDAAVFASQTELVTPDWSKLAARSEVKRIARWGLAFGKVAGHEGDLMFVPMDDVWLGQVDRPIVVAGRMFDRNASDEVVLSDDATIMYGKHYHVGDTITFTAMDPANAAPDALATGPSITARVVGIVHTPLSYVFSGGAFLSPGFVKKYSGRAYIAENAVVQLRHGAADAAALRRDANTDVAKGVPVLDFHVTGRRVTATTDVEGAMLRLLAAIVALTGVAFVGQALARSAANIGGDAPALRALGMTRTQMVTAATRPHLLTAGVVFVTTALTATVASRWFPVGLAGHVDPDRGVQLNIGLYTATAALATLFALGVVVASSWRAARSSGRSLERHGVWLTHLGLARPVSVRVGARMAFDNGGSVSRKGSAWPAVIGAATAVAGVVAIVTVNHGLTDAFSHPEVAGVAWDATVSPHQGDLSIVGGVSSTINDAVARQPRVAAISAIGRFVTEVGDLGVPVYTVFDRPTDSPVHLVTLSGRAPRSDDEIEFGPSTARDLGLEIGDSVKLADGASARVVGLGLFPTDVHAQFDEGAWVAPGRWSRLVQLGTQADSENFTEMVLAVRFVDRAHLDTQISSLRSALGSIVDSVDPAEQPGELINLHNVRMLPMVLAIFLTFLGVVAVGHALFSSVSRRRRDFAVLQSLGFTRGGVRAMIAAQATVVGLAGLMVGVPVGLVAGRAGWQAITDRVPLTFHSPLTVIALIIIAPTALIAANVLAIVPGRRAAKAKPALVLRSE